MVETTLHNPLIRRVEYFEPTMERQEPFWVVYFVDRNDPEKEVLKIFLYAPCELLHQFSHKLALCNELAHMEDCKK